MKALRWVAIAVGAVAILVTVLPLIPTNEALIRIWDFPRTQIAVVLTVTAAMAFPLHGRSLAFLAVAAVARSILKAAPTLFSTRA